MWNKSKKIISLVAAATFLGAAFTMTACDGGSYKGDKLDYTSSTTDGVSNGGFVVEKDGQISNVKILRDIGGGCGKEVLRVINAMPKWKPGIFNGEPVRTEFVLPITFNLESNVSEEHDREFLQTACDEF